MTRSELSTSVVIASELNGMRRSKNNDEYWTKIFSAIEAVATFYKTKSREKLNDFFTIDAEKPVSWLMLWMAASLPSVLLKYSVACVFGAVVINAPATKPADANDAERSKDFFFLTIIDLSFFYLFILT